MAVNLDPPQRDGTSAVPAQLKLELRNAKSFQVPSNLNYQLHKYTATSQIIQLSDTYHVVCSPGRCRDTTRSLDGGYTHDRRSRTFLLQPAPARFVLLRFYLGRLSSPLIKSHSPKRPSYSPSNYLAASATISFFRRPSHNRDINAHPCPYWNACER